MDRHLLVDVEPPVGREVDAAAVSRQLEPADRQAQQARQEAAAARQAAQAAGVDPRSRVREADPAKAEAQRQLAAAEDALAGAEGQRKMKWRQIAESIDRGREPVTRSRELTLQEKVDEETRLEADNARWARAGLGEPDRRSATERELVETRRELQRLRAQLGAKA